MNPDSDIFTPCRECGYDLCALLGPKSPGICPECGEAFNPYGPWRPRPLPHPVLCLLRMAWPTLAMLVLMTILGANLAEWVGLALSITWFIWIPAILYVILGWPPLCAHILAQRRPRREVRVRIRLLAAAGVATNLIVSLLWLSMLAQR
ncbi:MAG: hypothetical protein H6811_09215 [Phycisphaeraceae bacterium]|nr:hypothetical protein [Phycisphaeraceae bacterium]